MRFSAKRFPLAALSAYYKHTEIVKTLYTIDIDYQVNMSQLMRLWYLSHRRTAKAQARLGIRAVSPEPSLFAHMK